MVRKVIACGTCRKAKIRCIHSGVPPCGYCAKTNRIRPGECILAGPEMRRRRPPSTQQHIPSVPSSPADNDVFLRIPILKICSVFSRKFPELRFLHWPSFSKMVRSLDKPDSWNSAAKSRLLCASIIALCLPLSGESSKAPSAEHFATYVQDEVSTVDSPDVVVVQTLLALSMYEWGAGNGYRAWMHSGAAIRMVQSLQVLTQPSSLTAVEAEVFNRTLWSCFIMDRLVFCGKPQPVTLTLQSMQTHWPSGEEDFTFGHTLNHSFCMDEELGPTEHVQGDMNNYYGVLVRGFDIWSRILTWVTNGGRSRPGMCFAENHPWVQGSPWWLLHHELEEWRRRQECRMRYPDASVEGHAALGKAEQFAFINLVYYIRCFFPDALALVSSQLTDNSLLFLGREYMPFLPDANSKPAGPVDPPLLPMSAPEEWWSDRASDTFKSSAHIVNLLESLDEESASLCTPFAGFCSFSAATTNCYVFTFPNMNLGRSVEIENVLSVNLKFLDHFRKIWPMGEGWWVTIQHCKSLYKHAVTDRNKLRGRTRADFLALDKSIHDCRGEPPAEVDYLPSVEGREGNEGAGGDDNLAATTSLQELFAAYGDSNFDAPATDWSQSWPLWGMHPSIPFAIEGIPFDHNL